MFVTQHCWERGCLIELLLPQYLIVLPSSFPCFYGHYLKVSSPHLCVRVPIHSPGVTELHEGDTQLELILPCFLASCHMLGRGILPDPVLLFFPVIYLELLLAHQHHPSLLPLSTPSHKGNYMSLSPSHFPKIKDCYTRSWGCRSEGKTLSGFSA